jgi:hypothetical protein
MSAAINPALERRLRNLPEVGEDAPIKYLMNFGKFCGVRVCDLPWAYLNWFVNNFEPHSRQRYLFAAAVLEYRRRTKKQPEPQ